MIGKMNIPVHTALSDVFGSAEGALQHAKRWNDLAEQFQQRFGRKPAYITRAPGRVNLIGEHIDYALFGVLPAAIDRDILIACAPRALQQYDSTDMVSCLPGAVLAENLCSKYTRQEFVPTYKQPDEITEDKESSGAWFLDIDKAELRWESYVKAGYYGILNRYFSGGVELPASVNMLVSGSVPAGSGLSSSAALVVASTLSFLAVNNKLETPEALSQTELVQLAMLNEKRVGVNSGGMDQAASVMSDPSSALYITFYPSLAASAVPLPTGAVFVIANSLKVADKLLTAKHGYNLRVVETLVAARILANSLGVYLSDREKITLGEVVARYKVKTEDGSLSPDQLEDTLQVLLEKLDVLKPKVVHEGQLGVTMNDMVEMSGMSKALFYEVYLSWVDIEATHFQLYKRTKHVISEARRVLQFRKTCLDAPTASPNADVFDTLGQLMNESQESCSALFECSCWELDELTRLAREAGALGSRLTGAGWGGCTVSLVLEEKVEIFIRQVRETYEPYKNLDDDALNEVIFATRPGRGACVFKFD